MAKTPGIYNGKSAAPAVVVSDPELLPGGGILDGDECRDPLSLTGDIYTCPSGTLLGLHPTTGKYVQCVIGNTTAQYLDNAVALQVSPATAVELARRCGATTGNFLLVGPPTAAGTVAATAVAYTGINTTTGVVTVPDLNLDKEVDSFLTMTVAQGGTPITIAMEDYVVVNDDYTSCDVGINVAVGGHVLDSKIVNWPADLSTREWIRTQLNTNGQFTFQAEFEV